jgi:hypothetical protein
MSAFSSSYGELIEANDKISRLRKEATAQTDKIAAALDIANRYGGIDGDHHRAWVIDQMVRALTGDGYAARVSWAPKEPKT